MPPKKSNVPDAVKPAANAPAKTAAPAAVKPAPQAKAAPPPVANVQAAPRPVASAQVAPRPVSTAQAPQLDVASLIAKLRETDAIGVMTKLALKNQVDDLLKKFRLHYQGAQKTSLAELRQPYNMLVLKVLSLVQDKDPALAQSISNSREAIWGMLADRDKFNSIT